MFAEALERRQKGVDAWWPFKTTPCRPKKPSELTSASPVEACFPRAKLQLWTKAPRAVGIRACDLTLDYLKTTLGEFALIRDPPRDPAQ